MNIKFSLYYVLILLVIWNRRNFSANFILFPFQVLALFLLKYNSYLANAIIRRKKNKKTIFFIFWTFADFSLFFLFSSFLLSSLILQPPNKHNWNQTKKKKTYWKQTFVMLLKLCKTQVEVASQMAAKSSLSFWLALCWRFLYNNEGNFKNLFNSYSLLCLLFLEVLSSFTQSKLDSGFKWVDKNVSSVLTTFLFLMMRREIIFLKNSSPNPAAIFLVLLSARHLSFPRKLILKNRKAT